jgi:hypothetical protein
LCSPERLMILSLGVCGLLTLFVNISALKVRRETKTKREDHFNFS